MTTLNADQLMTLPLSEQMQLVAESCGGVEVQVLATTGTFVVSFAAFAELFEFKGNTLGHAWHQAFVKWCLLERDHNGLGDPDEESLVIECWDCHEKFHGLRCTEARDAHKDSGNCPGRKAAP